MVSANLARRVVVSNETKARLVANIFELRHSFPPLYPATGVTELAVVVSTKQHSR
jgi:hypothetical protein